MKVEGSECVQDLRRRPELHVWVVSEPRVDGVLHCHPAIHTNVRRLAIALDATFAYRDDAATIVPVLRLAVAHKMAQRALLVAAKPRWWAEDW